MIERIAVLIAIMSPITVAQPVPRFEVTSVKPGSNCPGGGGRGGTASRINSPDRLELRCRTLAELVKMAYVQFAGGQQVFAIGDVPISGGAPWAHAERFDIEAKAEHPQTPDMMRGPMLQKLLEERFQLKVHSSAVEIPVYMLSTAKGGPKLQAAEDGKCQVWEPGKTLPSAAERKAGVVHCGVFAPLKGRDDIAQMYGATMERFCRQLTALLDRKVIDRTGIEGRFDIQVELRPVSDGAPADSEPAQEAAKARGIESAIFAAVAKMGLKLEAGKGRREIPVVDHAERPAEN